MRRFEGNAALRASRSRSASNMHVSPMQKRHSRMQPGTSPGGIPEGLIEIEKLPDLLGLPMNFIGQC